VIAAMQQRSIVWTESLWKFSVGCARLTARALLLQTIHPQSSKKNRKALSFDLAESRSSCDLKSRTISFSVNDPCDVSICGDKDWFGADAASDWCCDSAEYTEENRASDDGFYFHFNNDYLFYALSNYHRHNNNNNDDDGDNKIHNKKKKKKNNKKKKKTKKNNANKIPGKRFGNFRNRRKKF
jgi:hypothetical protein